MKASELLMILLKAPANADIYIQVDDLSWRIADIADVETTTDEDGYIDNAVYIGGTKR